MKITIDFKYPTDYQEFISFEKKIYFAAVGVNYCKINKNFKSILNSILNYPKYSLTYAFYTLTGWNVAASLQQILQENH